MSCQPLRGLTLFLGYKIINLKIKMKGTGQQPFNPMMNRPNTLGNKPQSSIQ